MQPELGRMDADRFLAWAVDQPIRYELDNGDVWAVASERAIHARTKYRIARLLEDACGRDAPDCEVFGDGMAVRIDGATVYEPDALVRRGARLDNDAIFVFDPIVIVEVASPSTRSLDANVKLDRYFKLESLIHYVIVRPDTSMLLHYQRLPGGDLLTRIVRDGALTLDPPGMRLVDIFGI